MYWDVCTRERHLSGHLPTVEKLCARALHSGFAVRTTDAKESYEKQYATFRKLLLASNKEMSLSEIVDCISKIVVDNDREIVVKWDVR